MYKYEDIVLYVKSLAKNESKLIYLSERKLADKLKVSRMTVRKAFDQLEIEKIIKRTPNQKTVILKEEKQLFGTIASSGIIQGYAYILEPKNTITNHQFASIANEKDRLLLVISKSRNFLNSIESSLDEVKDIIEMQLTMLNDPEFISSLTNEIDNSITVENALNNTITNYEKLFTNIDDDYLKSRLKDFYDLRDLMLSFLQPKNEHNFGEARKPIIIVSNTISTNDLSLLDPKIVAGIISETGGKTDHSAIIAESLGIPMLVGVKDATKQITAAQPLLIDAYNGVIKFLDNLNIENNNNTLNSFCDNDIVSLSINADIYTDLSLLPKNVGIGLYRTEFLYQDKIPTIEEQQKVYEELIAKTNGDVVIRTLDIGGDKESNKLNIPNEKNPFLGLRGIRYSLHYKSLFEDQLEALFLASKKGKLKVMFPMVSTPDEIIEIKKIINQIKNKLKISLDNISFGLMLETPILIYYLELISKEFDFISIGTNDLIQYATASDRTNDSVSSSYQQYSPGLIRMLDQIIKTASTYNLNISVCGKMASTKIGALILAGLGYKHLSVSINQYNYLNSLFNKYDEENIKSFVKQALNLKNENEVIAYYEKK